MTQRRTTAAAAPDRHLSWRARTIAGPVEQHTGGDRPTRRRVIEAPRNHNGQAGEERQKQIGTGDHAPTGPTENAGMAPDEAELLREYNLYND